jgi:hypothetical protein
MSLDDATIKQAFDELDAVSHAKPSSLWSSYPCRVCIRAIRSPPRQEARRKRTAVHVFSAVPEAPAFHHTARGLSQRAYSHRGKLTSCVS